MIFVANLTLEKPPKKNIKKYSTYGKKKNSPPNEFFNTKETWCINLSFICMQILWSIIFPHFKK
jgi:hypothetical protein